MLLINLALILGVSCLKLSVMKFNCSESIRYINISIKLNRNKTIMAFHIIN